MILPGLIDPHVHFRDPGQTDKEDFTTGTAAALAGGFTLVFDMPNNSPQPVVSDADLRQKKHIARKKALCDYGLYFGALPTNLDEFARITPQVVGLKIYMERTTGPLLVEDKKSLEAIFRLWTSTKPIVVHAEIETFDLALSLARRFGKHLHVAHLSRKYEIEKIRQAKEEGMSISCEVSPHHLFLTEADVKTLGPYGVMRPPLRSKKDQHALWENLNIIDMIATDHAPHTMEEKQSTKIPFGVPGLETALPLMLTAVSEGKLAHNDVIRLMHEGPKDVFGLDKTTNSSLEVDENAIYTIDNKLLKTKCGWSPFHGWKVKGRVKKVIIRGKEVYRNGKVMVAAGFGKDVEEKSYA